MTIFTYLNNHIRRQQLSDQSVDEKKVPLFSRMKGAVNRRFLARLNFLAFFFCLLSQLPAQAQYRHLLHKTPAQRSTALAMFYNVDLGATDSLILFRKINDMRRLAIVEGDDNLLMETEVMRAGYLLWHQGKYSSEFVLSVLDTIKKAAIAQKKWWAEILVENMQALHHFEKTQNYELGFEHHRRVYELIKNLSSADFVHKQNTLYQMAGEYYMFNNFREAISYCLHALKSDPPEVLHPYHQRLTLLNTLGLCYQKLNMLDSSDYYLRKTLKLAIAQRRLEWDGIASGNLGYNLFLKRKYREAIPLLERDVRLAVRFQDWGLASNSQVVLANISLETKQLGQAGRQMELAREYVNRSGAYSRKRILYPLMAKYYTATGQLALAARYFDSAMVVNDSLNRKLNAMQLLRANQKVEHEQHKAEIANIEAQKTINILQRNILVFVVFLGMIATVLIYQWQRKKVTMQKEQTLRARQELEQASRQLMDFSRNIHEKNEMITLLQRQANSEKDQTVIRELQRSTILTDDDWTYFRDLFEKVHAGYLRRLREKLPGLTPAETRFMALSRLGLSTKEMASMLAVGTDAIRQYRTRLRKRLDVSDDVDFTELASNI
jgi:DNA-binding CsgD family transcriptional regulator